MKARYSSRSVVPTVFAAWALALLTVTVTVTLPELTPPTLLFTELEIAGQTDDPFAIVTVGGAGASSFGSASFSRNVVLTGVLQIIPTVATDGAGNPASRDVTVTP